MRVEIDTDVTQLFVGTRLPAESTCIQCDHTFDAGDRCTMQAIHQEDAPNYTLTRLSCPDCAPEVIPSPTLGRSEHLLAARLTAISNCESLTLVDPQLIQTSAPSEGSANTDDPITLVPTAELPDLTNTTYHIERDDEQRTPLCNCSPDTEYTRVAFGDLETVRARCCRTCLSVYRHEHDTNPLYGDEHPPLTQGLHHAQIGTGDPPKDDAVITTTQRARRPAMCTSVRAQPHFQE